MNRILDWMDRHRFISGALFFLILGFLGSYGTQILDRVFDRCVPNRGITSEYFDNSLAYCVNNNGGITLILKDDLEDFDWDVDSVDRSLVEVDSENDYDRKETTFYFRGKGNSGRTTIKLIYHREFKVEPPARTFELRIDFSWLW